MGNDNALCQWKVHPVRLTDAEQARRAAALAAAQLDRVTNDVIPSAARTVDGAKPENKMLVFRLQAVELMNYVRKGVVDKIRIVDALQDMAQTNGLIELHGQDEIQAIMSYAADEPRSNRPAAQKAGASTASPAAPGLISRRASDVLPEQIEWLWPGRIAAGKLTLIGGKPGLGKSLVTVSIASTVTLGAQWPCNEGCSPCGSVVIFSAEDGLADTIVPRLMAVGADRTRVELVTGVNRGEDRRTFDLKADIDLLEKKVRELGDVRLIIIDPISAYMGKADGHGNVETRNVLEPVAEMADRLRIAVVAVTHLNKGGAGNQGVLERFTGSIAFIAAARAGFAIIGDDENEGRVLFLQVKNNIAPAQRGLAFRCLQKIVGDEIVATFVDWENEHVALSADDALRAAETAEGAHGGSAKDQAVEFLLSILAPGVPVLVQDVGRDAVGAGLHEAGKPVAQNKPLRAARTSLGVETKKLGMGQGWAWVLPKVPSDPEGAHSQDRAPSDMEGTFESARIDR